MWDRRHLLWLWGCRLCCTYRRTKRVSILDQWQSRWPRPLLRLPKKMLRHPTRRPTGGRTTEKNRISVHNRREWNGSKEKFVAPVASLARCSFQPKSALWPYPSILLWMPKKPRLAPKAEESEIEIPVAFLKTYRLILLSIDWLVLMLLTTTFPIWYYWKEKKCTVCAITEDRCDPCLDPLTEAYVRTPLSVTAVSIVLWYQYSSFIDETRFDVCLASTLQPIFEITLARENHKWCATGIN